MAAYDWQQWIAAVWFPCWGADAGHCVIEPVPIPAIPSVLVTLVGLFLCGFLASGVALPESVIFRRRLTAGIGEG